jgi:hypothetical protein
MSKSNYGEMLGLLQYIDSIRNQKPAKGLFKKKDKPVDLMSLLEQKKREAQVIETFIEEQAKLKKKDEKKEDKKGWEALSPIQQAAYLTLGIQLMAFMWLSFFMKFKGM